MIHTIKPRKSFHAHKYIKLGKNVICKESFCTETTAIIYMSWLHKKPLLKFYVLGRYCILFSKSEKMNKKKMVIRKGVFSILNDDMVAM